MSFALYLDENVDSLLADLLRALGHDVLTTQAAVRRGHVDNEPMPPRRAGRFSRTTAETTSALRLNGLGRVDGHSGILICKDVSPQEIRAWILDLFELYPAGIADLYLILPLAA